VSGSYTVDAFVAVERGTQCDAVTIASSGNNRVDLHVSNLDGDWDPPLVALHAAVGEVNVYLRVDPDDAVWLARRILVVWAPRPSREVEIA
jgi:hypothetical protein